jgi:archaellum component FlaF (FlaF/FlaG flagellin family)
MTVKSNLQKALRRLLCSRRGTAEVIGSVMFLLIIMFFFSNVYLWHDRATQVMDSVLSEKMNSPVSIQIVNMNSSIGVRRLNVTNNGGVDAYLSRLWWSYYGVHSFVDLEGKRVSAGNTIEVVVPSDVPFSKTVTFKVLTTQGNTAACTYYYRQT